MWMARRVGEEGATHWRVHGLLEPPVNPFLKEEAKPRVKTRGWWGQEAEPAGAAAAGQSAGGESVPTGGGTTGGQTRAT